MLALLQTVAAAATTVCDVIDKAPEPIHEERQGLKDLRKALESLNSDIMVYKVLMNVIENDNADLNGRSPHMHLLQRCVMGYGQLHLLTSLIHYNITETTER